ncbi:MAG: T9SS type A sorting domain-containing protein [Chitinophagales bacterium]|nr:T9SS type A sorting domain-containing protein [Chitinophagales bacterium]
MKKQFVVALMLVAFYSSAQNTFPSTGSVGIGTTAPSASSILEIKSTTQGVLIPRMTKTQRDAIVAPVSGLLIYQTNNSSGFYYYDGAWSAIAPKSANKSLNNLTAPTSIPVDLLPVSIGAINLGSDLLKWNNLYLNNLIFADESVQSTAFISYISGAGISITGKTISNIGDQNALDDANLNLSNLSATSINQSLISNTNNAFDLGSSSLNWRNLYLGGDIYSGNERVIKNSGTNSFFGLSSGINNSSGIDNTFLGNESGASNTTGYNNSALGNHALYSNTFGYINTAIGDSAMFSNVDGYVNTAVGDGALYSNTSGSKNTAVGAYTMHSNTTGKVNTAIGGHALFSNTLGDANVAIGASAMEHSTIGNTNISIGKSSMVNLINGSNNTGIGNHVLYSNTSLNYLTAVGDSALSFNNGGSGQNVAFGASAGYANSTGSNNCFIGYHGGITVATGSQNTFVGSLTDASGINLTNATAIGYSTVVTTNNSMRFGNGSVTFWGFGANQSANKALIVGTSALNGNGAYCTTGGTWTNTSSRSLKEDFSFLDKQEILHKINQLEISKWKYKGTENEYHIGPMAEDFYAAFKVGHDSQSISTIDPAGIALIGIQALNEENELLKKNLAAQNTEIDDLKNKVSDMKNLMLHLEQSINDCCLVKSNSLETPTNISSPGTLASLEQNNPNPFNKNTLINVFLPSNITSAQLIISNIQGTTLKEFKISQTGSTQLQIYGGELAAGVYYYSLIIEGKAVSTKKMELIKD